MVRMMGPKGVPVHVLILNVVPFFLVHFSFSNLFAAMGDIQNFDGDIQNFEGDIPDLQEIWCSAGPEPHCYTCGEPIPESEAIIRTFSVRPLTTDANDRENTRPPAHVKRVQALGSSISIHDRHLACIHGVAYVTVSHVWDHDVSTTQARGPHSPQPLATRREVFERPLKIHDALLSSRRTSQTAGPPPPPLELWHDYLSVPQWHDAAKEAILTAIPLIYGRAAFTLAFLADVAPQIIDNLRHGATSELRLAGVTGVCSAAWFARVWTAMEFIRSARLVPMLAGYVVVDDAPGVFLGQAREVFDAEVALQGDVVAVERMARQQQQQGGQRLLPWNVDSVWRARADKVVDYGRAFSLLARRACRSDRDFFHALRGVVPGRQDGPLQTGARAACRQVAVRCLEAGDYSPLLITPWLGARDFRNDRGWSERMGYNDIVSWPLGFRVSPPALHGSFRFEGEMPVVELETIGTVRTIRRFLHPDQDANFANVARAVLDHTGPDVDDFVETLGTRLYDQDKGEIMARLATLNRREALEIALQKQYDVAHRHWPLDGFRGSKWVADTMGLSNPSLPSHKGQTPFEYLQHHGSSMHLAHWQAIIEAMCPACHDSFLFRAALYESPTEVRGAVAYRIPGLQYHLTRPEGVGLLVKNGKIVGRMAWACPTCPCHQREMVKLSIPDLPLPMPREQLLDST